MIKLKKSDKTKQVFHYMDPKLSIDRLVIEKYKAGKIVYYPFRIQRDGKIIDKYKKINKIVIELDGKIPGKGLARSIRGGCGLTKVMNPLIYFLEDKFPTITDINIQKKVSSKIDGNTFKLNIKDYFTFFRKSQSYINTEKENRNVFINNYLADLLPATFSKRKNQYTDGVISRTLDGMQNIKLSAEDQKSLLDILSSSTIDKSFYLLKSKEVINEKYIEEVIGEYKGLLEQKTETTTLEKKRQSFFKEHSRILSQVLALPVVYFKKEAYVGGKGLDNKGGKVIDFLYQNKLISNLVLVEVKTHKTPIFNKSPIRGDDVFSYTSVFSGAINQLLDQKHNLLRDYANLVTRGDDYFEVFDPYCFLIAGNVSDLTKNQKRCFSLLRGNNRNIVIITYDELLEKIHMILSLFKK